MSAPAESPASPPLEQGHRRQGPGWNRGLCWLLILVPALAHAGPPFITDDPEPVELDHWEVYLASIDQRTADGRSGTAPHLEVNYGAFPDIQVHAIVPLAYDSPGSGPGHAGLGDIEMGAKWRFLHETDLTPQVGIFPLLELPTGDQSRGLGAGHTQAFLPVWAQKAFGAWTAYGGAGYWINPGAGNRNYWFEGIVLQRQIIETLAIGGEWFHASASTSGGSSSTGFNIGATYDCTEHLHLLASAGRDFSGPDAFLGYAAVQVTY